MWLPEFLCAVVFFKACHWPAWSACCFSWIGTSSVELPICLLSLAAIFFVKVFFSGPVTGLLGRFAAFRQVGFFHWASSLLVVSSCHFFREGFFFQGLSPACLVGLLLFVKLDFSRT